MRYLELLLTDIADRPDTAVRHEWVHRDHIETIEPYLHAEPGHDPMLWLELTLTSGRTRYIPLRPVRPEAADEAARTAISALLDDGHHPLHAAVLSNDSETDQAPGSPC